MVGKSNGIAFFFFLRGIQITPDLFVYFKYKFFNMYVSFRWYILLNCVPRAPSTKSEDTMFIPICNQTCLLYTYYKLIQYQSCHFAKANSTKYFTSYTLAKYGILKLSCEKIKKNMKLLKCVRSTSMGN